jgi:transcription factor SOX7/8/10/18 (SOX group E/F)
MTAEICLSTAPVQELYFTDTDEDAMAQFQSALDACVHGWYQGNNVALLENNIQDLFGIMLMQYFERCLTEQVGQPVAFTFADGSNGPQTFVQMPKNTNAQAHLQMPPNGVDPQTHIGQQPATFSKVVSAGVKKAPRPMNCWIIFRDAMHKKLKAENPHLTVQQICKLFLYMRIS